MPFVIKRIDEGVPLYWSPKVGANFGSPGNGWAKDPADAERFDTREDGIEARSTRVPEVLRPFCSVVST